MNTFTLTRSVRALTVTLNCWKKSCNMKIWQKDKAALAEVDKFTVGKDREMDAYLAPFDVLGSLAHIEMLESIGLLTADELTVLQKELKQIYKEIQLGSFVLEDSVEDI